MPKRAWSMVAVAVLAPAIALASHPLMVHFRGKNGQTRQTMQVEHKPSGPVKIETWRWASRQGDARIVFQRTEGVRLRP